MYVFVRFTGYVLIVFGLLFMLASFLGAIYLVIPQNTLITTLNNYMLSNGGKSVFTQDSLAYFALAALIIFLSGMFTSAFGQLMLVFADIGHNSRETNIILRSLRNKNL